MCFVSSQTIGPWRAHFLVAAYQLFRWLGALRSPDGADLL